MSGWAAVNPGPEALAHLDPYLEFADETGNAYLFASGAPHDPELPLILELNAAGNRTAADFCAEWGHSPWLHVPNAYRRPPKGLERTRHLSAKAGRTFFRELADPSSTLRDWVARVSPALPVREISIGSALSVRQPRGRAIPGMVVTGVIDDGLAFAHERFRQGPASRMACLWNQDGASSPAPGFGYGRHYTRSQIDSYLAAASIGRHIDEERVYRASGYANFSSPGHKPVARRHSHGTHVMDLATWLDPATPPRLRPIIGVQLPVATTAQTAGATLARHVLDGLRYIIERADAFALDEGSGPLPIVVNVSYGLIAGPHDGSSVLERAMDEMIRLRNKVAPFRIVLPAGNSHLARCHASFRLAQGAHRTLQWRVQPEDRTPSFLEIWLPERKPAHAKVRVTVTTPTGAVSLPVTEGGICAWIPAGEVLCKVIYLNGVAAGRPRNMILVAIAPTATLDRSAQVAPSGIWRVRIENLGPAATVDAWIQRDDTAPGYPAWGRQSYFDDPDYVRHDNAGRLVEDDGRPPNSSYVRREGSLNAIATGAETIVVGGVRQSDGAPARSSAAGPVILPPGRGSPNATGPEAMAPSEDSPALHNVMAAGSRSGSITAMNGTSVAAPQVARMVAEWMATSQRNDRKAVFNEGLRHEPGSWPTPTPRAERGGGGRIPMRRRVNRGIE